MKVLVTKEGISDEKRVGERGRRGWVGLFINSTYRDQSHGQSDLGREMVDSN